MKRALVRYVLATFLYMFFACSPDIDPLPDNEGNEVVTPAPFPDPDPEPDPDPDPSPDDTPSYDNLAAYLPLRDYVDRSVSPDFKLGAAIPVDDFFKKASRYVLAVENLDEITPENAFKNASVVRSDGSMDFSRVKRTLDEAEAAGLTVYGHALAWHAQQTSYLKHIIKGKRVELPPSEKGEMVLLEADFNDGYNPFIGWGNNSTRMVSGGTLIITNPSAVNNWEAQFAYDMSDAFEVDNTYKLKFKIKGSGSGKLASGFQIVDGYNSAGYFPEVQFDTQWKEVELECICSAAGATRLVFSFGEFVGDIYIDDFSFIDANASYRYDPLTEEEKREVLIEEMDRWIKGMMEVTASRVSAWDVVNEPISGLDRNGDGFYELESGAWGSSENFYWQDYLGAEEYVRIVVEMARKYYTEYGGTSPLRLFINDYNLESDWDDNKKLKSLIHWIEIWESDGITKIDGIGTQMHISYHADPNIQKSKENHIVKMLHMMAETGKLVKISELDMGYVDVAGNTLNATSLNDSQHRQMADYYEFIVRKYFEIIPPAQQYGITHWAPVDPDSSGWRGGEPLGLWDKNFKRKYAYAGFANGLMGHDN